jgi:mono/diheme cytochrome c family protein
MKTLIILLMTFGMSVTFSANAEDFNNIKIAKGRYLVEISGCNDCHTSGYAPSGGKVPEAQWLLGDQLGYNGPWGTTYPINLREYISHISEEEWVKKAKTLKARPPMPSWALNAMTKDDLKTLYAFIKSLGPAKNSIPAYLPPGKTPKTAYIQWPMPPK